jgi:hypothetical protein
MSEAHRLLQEYAEAVAEDVLDTYPDAYTDFDIYVEDGVYAEAPEQVFGVIDMGDTGQWALQLIENDRYDGLSWTDVSGAFDPIDVKKRIIAKRKGDDGTDPPSSG